MTPDNNNRHANNNNSTTKCEALERRWKQQERKSTNESHNQPSQSLLVANRRFAVATSPTVKSNSIFKMAPDDNNRHATNNNNNSTIKCEALERRWKQQGRKSTYESHNQPSQSFLVANRRFAVATSATVPCLSAAPTVKSNSIFKMTPDNNNRHANNNNNNNERTKKVLIVAEKPLMAKQIASLLGGNVDVPWSSSSSFDCHNLLPDKKTPWVFEFDGQFQGKVAKLKVTSTYGHIMAIDFPPRLNIRTEVDPAQLFDCAIIAREQSSDQKMRQFLAMEAEHADYLVLMMDCDKEGENICFQVIDAVRKKMGRKMADDEFMARVFRARFSCVTSEGIRKALDELVKPNLNESRSVDARQELDLRIGCAFTRYQTNHFRQMFSNLDSTIISFGPCQTPTLGFCVARHDEIEQFRPQPYWQIQAVVVLPGGAQQTLALEWCRERQFSFAVAQTLFAKVKDCTVAKVCELTEEHCSEAKPEGMRTVEMLKKASIGLGMSPAETLDVAQKLYTRGYISYPRTETTAYPEGFDYKEVLRELKKLTKFRHFVDQILLNGICTPEAGRNRSDHPPITPLKTRRDYLFPAFLQDYKSVYEQVAKQFLATLMKPCTYLVKRTIFGIGGELFVFKRIEILDRGFTAVLNDRRFEIEQGQEEGTNSDHQQTNDPKAEAAAELLRVGDELPIKTKTLRLIERATVAPDHLTEAELITLMEEHGIGTDASISRHISNICDRKYVKVETNRRRLVPSPLGVALVHGYQRVDPDLVLPTTRAQMEKKLQQIADGTADYETVKAEALDLYREKFVFYRSNSEIIDNCFSIHFPKKTAGSDIL